MPAIEDVNIDNPIDLNGEAVEKGEKGLAPDYVESQDEEKVLGGLPPSITDGKRVITQSPKGRKYKYKVPRVNFHIGFDPELYKALGDYADYCVRTRTDIIQEAVKHHLDHLSEYDKLSTINSVLKRRFILPKGFTAHSFWIVLYLNSVRYPNLSAKDYWGDAVYISAIDKSHSDIFIEIKDEIYRETNLAKKTV